MTFEEYQRAAISTGRSKSDKNELFHLALGLVGESGEIAEKLKKLVRDNDSDENKIDREDMRKELGDVLWYVAALANYFNFPLEAVAITNIDKLADRKKRGVIKGAGDNR